ncbi:hypothetical protein LEP1GSC036_0718 [Leptospira weilii str. 2006001853]|uniref:Uncharacterized protein n=4 Tax=Leptospira weilii TaxID=28184 RepID=A0A828Z6R3_9LEPT|nr:hypothetical protein LEP1GSC036_0718 [Leptospira weilii str. 2006001853]EMJ61735.1 hypothetical protein LEP1GSC051_1364 [Leptospira sp. P2653]EMM74957.1 hypothetical protein LEP1GSC038_0866 [Leptospira weilii str. 2006001855]EMN46606.1 hypothetical protein LEP1GSC086_4122 [Leptospira weilii str. LNT 1234]EMN90834.1 hypothetical protein LEP1GSC108_2278 [Leptospira weilii str. UI 13098]OMI17883.1 hypothetical protein BUQ74_08070 [Leptospira weilii serovar Heyan]QDK23787.1 hypothetical protei
MLGEELFKNVKIGCKTFRKIHNNFMILFFKIVSLTFIVFTFVLFYRTVDRKTESKPEEAELSNLSIKTKESFIPTARI